MFVVSKNFGFFSFFPVMGPYMYEKNRRPMGLDGMLDDGAELLID